ncbi:MAG: hypothetical protein A2Z51_02860 [Deltaproteobacteria bacterium RBG_19FT_COMBO_52_11]|nr:MAG: hypothetical protein A2Z51_02860 [Deltaproteobacteria bacterium RBG_19FT_COMBO_52_11]
MVINTFQTQQVFTIYIQHLSMGSRAPRKKVSIPTKTILGRGCPFLFNHRSRTVKGNHFCNNETRVI